MTRPSLLAALMLCIAAATPTYAQTTKAEADLLRSGCQFFLNHKPDQRFDSRGRTRFENITYCEDKTGTNWIWFDATIMIPRTKMPGDYFAPKLLVQVVGSDLKTVVSERELRAEIPQCAGGNFQMHPMPARSTTVQPYAVVVTVVEAGGDQGCGPSDPFKNVVRTAARLSRANRDCNQKDMDTDEVEVCNWLKENASK